MINVLDKWMSESITNFNIVVGGITILMLVSVGVLLWVWKQFGKPDERTNGLFFKITAAMFIMSMLTSSIFIAWVDKDIQNFRQIFLLLESLVFLVGAVYSVLLYLKEFK